MSDALEQYTRIFGFSDLIPEQWFTSKKYKSVDQVYRECVKKHITWRKLTGWNEDKKKDIQL